MKKAKAIKRDRLVGWLCIIRLNFSEGTTIGVPPVITDALGELGWIVYETDESGLQHVSVTTEGKLVTDLAAPEWGINPIGGC